MLLICRKNTGTGRSGDQSKRLHKFSLRRRGSRSTAVGRGEGGDRVKLVESEGGEVEVAPVGERDVMSDDEIENVKVGSLLMIDSVNLKTLSYER